ncbi:hypothetical protein [Azospirillum rugosum]|uniref:Uncharacterized protein n=1 Tax=Azospirillum rugosum TaxID=416170 RepID=A0ABS4SXI0_9PROT|nr:hypothetical protein [Azospirillum rugosum]MBP2297273.1 hypothetical protein [Azospirillum rugosum]MDQ0531115.1 hypothetical protein [Azospirillum rugosum]
MPDSNVILQRTGEATCKYGLQVRTEGATVKDHLTVQAEGQQPASRTITVNERPLLNGNDRISHDAMKRIAHDCYDEFDRQRKLQDGIAADAAGMEELKAIEAQVTKTRKESGR